MFNTVLWQSSKLRFLPFHSDQCGFTLYHHTSQSRLTHLTLAISSELYLNLLTLPSVPHFSFKHRNSLNKQNTVFCFFSSVKHISSSHLDCHITNPHTVWSQVLFVRLNTSVCFTSETLLSSIFMTVMWVCESHKNVSSSHFTPKYALMPQNTLWLLTGN